MRPNYRIIADARDITATICDRLIFLSIVDEAGFKSDTMTLALDNRNGKVVIPSTGAEIEVWMGYTETGLVPMGLYVVDEIAVEGPSDILTITANAADMRAGFKELKERSWDAVSLGDIVKTIAADHGYTAKVAAELAPFHLEHVDQTESDLHFLTRLAKEHAAVAKVAGGVLLFVPEGNAQSASGKSLPPVRLTRGDLERWSMRSRDRKRYNSVRSFWQDMESGEKRSVVVGEGSPQLVMMAPRPTAEAARNAAMAMRETVSRGESTLDFTCAGHPDLMAETPLTMESVAEGIDGNWVITRATHKISGNGYSVTCSAKPPKTE